MGDKDATECILADEQGIARAARILASGGLVAMPTETVYGLAARADSDEAVAKIYAAKGRPSFNPLIVHVHEIEQAHRYADMSEDVVRFAQASWPGPTTLVLPLRADAPLAKAVTAGLDTVALRIPKHRVARELLRLTGLPLAAPSANRSGLVSPTTANHVLASLDGRIELVLDAGQADEGIESTILKQRGDGRWEQLRPGPIDTSLWHPSYFKHAAEVRPGQVEAPGQLAQHYSPGKPVRLEAEVADEDEVHLGFGEVPGDISLSVGGNLEEAAQRLYDCLHQAAASDKPRIAVAPVPVKGIGAAINDRLRRAAA